MLKFFLPRTDDFFVLFRNTSKELLEVAKLFKDLIQNLDKPESYLQAIDAHENRADVITTNTLEKLHKTFITPFDRNDIHRFVKKLDDCIDSVQRTSHRVWIYQLKSLPKEIHEMSGLCLRSAEILLTTTEKLHLSKNSISILALTDTVNDLENEAERLLLSGVSRLFQEETDLRQLLKIKEIYEYTKSIMNGCQAVANIIKDILLEYS